MRLRIRLLDVVVEIHTEDPVAAELLTLLWSEMTTDDDDAPARTYVVARDDEGRWVATAGETVEAIHETLWGVTDALRYQMLELCEEKLERFVTLHAAAVARDGELVLLAGESGAGKTTLTLALLDAGGGYLSDDLAPVSIATGLVHPFPKPLGVKDPAAWDTVGAAFAGTALAPPEGSFLVPPSRWAVVTEPMEPRALVFPRYSAGADPELEPLSPGRAAALASAYVRKLDPSTLGLLNRLCARAASYRLTYGSTAGALGCLDRVLTGGT